MTKKQDWDDGRTVADMSEVSGGFREPEAEMDKEDRRMYIFGALGATALIAMIFLAAAFVVILLMVLLW